MAKFVYDVAEFVAAGQAPQGTVSSTSLSTPNDEISAAVATGTVTALPEPKPAAASSAELEAQRKELEAQRKELEDRLRQLKAEHAEKEALRLAVRSGKKVNAAKVMAAELRKAPDRLSTLMAAVYDGKVSYLVARAKTAAAAPKGNGQQHQRPLDYGTFTKQQVLDKVRAAVGIGASITTPDVHRLFNADCCHKNGWVGGSSIPQALHALAKDGLVRVTKVGGTNHWTRVS